MGIAFLFTLNLYSCIAGVGLREDNGVRRIARFVRFVLDRVGIRKLSRTSFSNQLNLCTKLLVLCSMREDLDF